MKIVVLDGYTLNPGDLSWNGIKRLGDLTVYPRTSEADIVTRAAEAEILLTNKTPLKAEVINQLPQLKYIGVLATGYNVVDIEAARQKGIIVTNIPSYSTESVAQMVFAHLLAITNHVEHYAQENKNGKWCQQADFSYSDYPLIELTGKKIGAYYGCLLLRPGKEMGFDDPENPCILEDFIRALGAEPVIYALRNACCGGYCTMENRDFARKQVDKIMENAKSQEAECLITACPLCMYNLRENATDGLPVMYFTELLAKTLGVD